MRRRLAKTFLCLLAIGILTFLIWSAYFLFLRKEHPIWGLNAVVGAIAVLVTLAVVALSVKVLRGHPYRRTPPRFGVVLAVVAVVVLVLAFAGVQPLSDYKDDAISSVKSAFGGGSTSDSGKTATVERIDAFGISINPRYVHPLYVTLKPTTLARANVTYIVDLYEKGNYRSSGVVVWNQPELNVLTEKKVQFPLSQAEYSAYAYEGDLRNIFSVTVHE